MSDLGAITSFRGEYAELSNFFGKLPVTAEHLFQCCKTTDWSSILWILSAPTPKEAKRRGRSVKLRDDWDEICDEVMWCVVQCKFQPGTRFAKLLLSTDDAALIEGNNWGDTKWGAVFSPDGELRGQNKLGADLMLWRDQLREMEK